MPQVSLPKNRFTDLKNGTCDKNEHVLNERCINK